MVTHLENLQWVPYYPPKSHQIAYDSCVLPSVKIESLAMLVQDYLPLPPWNAIESACSRIFEVTFHLAVPFLAQ